MSNVSVRLSPAKNPTTVPHSGQKKIKEIGQTFCCNLKSACVKAIWDLFPQNERQVTKIHSKIWPGSKWYITCHGCCLIWGPKLFSPCQIPLFSIDFWNVQWAIPPSVPWRLVAHFVTTGLICFSLKAKTNTSKKHSIAADVTIFPSFPQSYHLHLHNCRLIYVLYEAQIL